MPLTRAQKETLVASVTEKLGKQKSLVFSLYQGLTAFEVSELRRELRKVGAEMQVVKNTLLLKAMKDAGIATDGLTLEGPIAVTYSYEDEVAGAKALAAFAKKHQVLKVQSGVLANKLLSEKEVKALAALPTKQEMLAKTVYTIKAPITSFVGVLSGSMRKFVRALALISEQKQ